MDIIRFQGTYFSQNAMNCKLFDSRKVCISIFITYLYLFFLRINDYENNDVKDYCLIRLPPI